MARRSKASLLKTLSLFENEKGSELLGAMTRFGILWIVYPNSIFRVFVINLFLTPLCESFFVLTMGYTLLEQGGGLIRSAGGDKRNLLGRKKEEWELSDERILGSGDFVEKVLSDLDQFEKRKIIRKIALAELIERISAFLSIEKKEVLSGNRKQRVCQARDLICFLALKDIGYKFSDVAKSLNIHPVTAVQGAEKGRKLVDKYEGIWGIVK